MKIVAVIQARMGSTRLPGKVLMDICGRTMLERVVRRTQNAQLVDEVIVATTTNHADDAIVHECNRLGVALFRGSEDDVLDRYFCAARTHSADAVVRITSDCPLIDPELIDQVIAAFCSNDCDYAANIIERTYPRGLDTEAIKIEALERAWREAKEPYQRAHVSPYIFFQPQLFPQISVKGDRDSSQYRWTVDTQPDLELVRTIYARLGNDDDFSWQDVLDLVEREPELAEINRHVEQKKVEQG